MPAKLAVTQLLSKCRMVKVFPGKFEGAPKIVGIGRGDELRSPVTLTKYGREGWREMSDAREDVQVYWCQSQRAVQLGILKKPERTLGFGNTRRPMNLEGDQQNSCGK